MKYSDIDIDQIKLRGKKAFNEGLELDACPFRPESLAEEAWIEGWQNEYYLSDAFKNDDEYLSEDQFFLRYGWIAEDTTILDEAVYQGKTVPLRKVMRGDSKRHKVYVNSGKKDAQGRAKAKKVEFGSPQKGPGSELRVRKGNAARRKSFAARHNCKTAKDPKTARYWSCRAPSSKAKGQYW